MALVDTSNPDALTTAVSQGCYGCIPPGMQADVMIYLLNEILGTGLTPQELVTAAKCMQCIPGDMKLDVQLYLLCQIANQ